MTVLRFNRQEAVLLENDKKNFPEKVLDQSPAQGSRKARLERLSQQAKVKGQSEPSAADADKFLYNDDGLPS